MMILLFLAAAFIGLLIGASILWLGRRMKWRFKLPLLGLALLPFVGWLWLFGPSDPTDPDSLRKAYEFEFGQPPPPDVNSIQSRQVVVGDAGVGWLRFHASPETLDALLEKFSPSDKPKFHEVSGGANVPSWWHPEQDQMIAFYRASDWSPHFQNSEAVIAHDLAKHTVYFCHAGFH
jgi:hypothetical protein